MRYRIGDLELSLQNFSLFQDEMAEKFVSVQSGTADFNYRTAEMELSLIERSPVLKYTGSYELLKTERGLFLLNHWAGLRHAYGFWIDDLDGDTNIYMNPEIQTQKQLGVSFLLSTAGLHRKLLQKQAIVLHASYIEYRGRAILFMGPSGIGKSTQAELWNRCENAPILNGDRVLLRQRDGIWYAYGYPCCGSSPFCVNRTLRLGAIVVLRQAPENRVGELSAAQRVLALTTAAEFYPWEPWEQETVLSLAQELAQQNVIGLSCRADCEAVAVLKDYLETIL